MRYVNLGCGGRYHPDWINIDMTPTGAEVVRHDLSRGIPLADASCDVIYASHLLEHILHSDAPTFLKECYRVMRPGGVIRVAVPDLERICREYLAKLDGALNGDPASAKDLEWITLEMYDQSVRERSGGEMLSYLRQDPLPNEAFVYKRIGEEGRNIVRGSKQKLPLLERESGAITLYVKEAIKRARAGMTRMFVRMMMGAGGVAAFDTGRFRLTGEVHYWMYDRYSLAQLLLAAGFRDPTQYTAKTSSIPNWSRYNLDTLPDGTIIKPDSLFMEAIRPDGK